MGKLLNWFWNDFVATNDKKREDAQPEPIGYTAVYDVKCANDDNNYHLYDVFRPEGVDGVLPAVVDVHGGGWYYGDHKLNGRFCKYLASKGFVVVSIAYRLAPDATIFDQVQDCFLAINHICQNADEYGIDLDKMFIAGDSAGGHLVGLIVEILKSDTLKQKWNVSSNVDFKAASMICPACEPQDLLGLGGLTTFYFNSLFGKGYRHNEMKDLVSFKHNLTGDICPIFFITGENDPFKKTTLQAYDDVKALGVKTSLHFAKKAEGYNPEHVFNVTHWEWEQSKAANDEMLDFFLSCI